MQDGLHALDIRIGQNLKQIRKARKVSQGRLAEALGITFQQIQKYENGTNRISVSRLIAISQVLDAPVLDFLPANDPAPPAAFAPDPNDQHLIRLFNAIQDAKLRKTILALLTRVVDCHTPTASPHPKP
jgi:transcriptional regulator with XRE-family HTH domain